jgi:hypothetical protein
MIHNLVTGLLFLSLLFSSHCFGRFTLVQKVHGINDDLNVGEGKINVFTKSIFMILMGVAQLYTGAILLDIVFLNLVEFWTEKNPLTVESPLPQTKTLADGSEVQIIPQENALHIQITKDKNTHHFMAFKEKKGKLFVEKNGTLEEIQVEHYEFGDLVFLSSNGKKQILSKKELAFMQYSE